MSEKRAHWFNKPYRYGDRIFSGSLLLNFNFGFWFPPGEARSPWILYPNSTFLSRYPKFGCHPFKCFFLLSYSPRFWREEAWCRSFINIQNVQLCLLQNTAREENSCKKWCLARLPSLLVQHGCLPLYFSMFYNRHPGFFPDVYIWLFARAMQGAN